MGYACWQENTDGVWTRHPQLEGVTWAGTPLGDLYTRCSAVHEAGHAVLALACGLGVRSVALLPAEGAPFHTHIEGSAKWDGYAVMLASGERAADRWLREIDAWTPERAWAVERLARSDREEAAAQARQHEIVFDFLAHPRDGWTQVCTRADERLNHHWRRIIAVADALMDQTKLDAKAVARLAGLPNSAV